MARVNLERQFFEERPRYLKLARLMGWNEYEAIGRLVLLWHGSQEAGAINADAEEICDWADLPPGDCDQFINALCHKSVRYVDYDIKLERYVIKGNESQIENLKKYTQRALKAAKARWGKTTGTKLSDSQNSDKLCLEHATSIEIDAPSTTQACLANANTKQCNSMQFNAIQLSIKAKETRAREPNASDLFDADSNVGRSFLSDKNDKKSKSSKKVRNTSWSDDNEFNECFYYLNKLKPFRAIFDAERDQKKLNEYRRRYSLTIRELEREIYKYVDWYSDKKMKSPRGALTNWLSSYAERRDEKIQNSKQRITPFSEDTNGAVF